MKKMSINLAAIVLSISALMVFMSGCSKGNDNPPTSGGGGGGGGINCGTVATAFSANVLPLMTTKCSGSSNCHGTGATNSGGVLLTHAQISGKASSIRSQVSSGQMPRSGTLTTVEKNTILCWIDAGTPNN